MRIRAVFYDSRVIQAFFTFLWLTVLAGSLFQPSCVKFTNADLPTGRECLPTAVTTFCTTTSITVMVHDTMVFLAISARLLLISLEESWSRRIRLFFSGQGIPRLSRMLIRSGQQYYLYGIIYPSFRAYLICSRLLSSSIVALINVTAVILLLAPALQARPDLRSLGIIPSLVIHNIMACRVYREVKLGLLTNGTETTRFSSMRTETSGPSTVRFQHSLPMSVFRTPSTSGSAHGAS